MLMKETLFLPMNLSKKIVLIGDHIWKGYQTSLFFKINVGKNLILGMNFLILSMNLKIEINTLKCTIAVRSSNINAITSELEEHWNFIVENDICIPTHEILQGDEDKMVRYISTSFLADKILCDITSSPEVPSSLMEDEDAE